MSSGRVVVCSYVACGVLGVALAAGCEEQPTEPVGSSRSALLASVSAPFDVERYPIDFDEGAEREFHMACGTERCLVAYDLELSDNTQHAFASRMDASGALLDAPRIHLGTDEVVTDVVAAGDEFLIVTTGSLEAPIEYHRVRGSDGRVLADATSRLPASRPDFIASTGASFALVLPGAQDFTAEVRLYDLDFAALGEPISFPVTSSWVELVPGPGQYLAVGRGKALRIDASSGEPLDDAPIDFSLYNTGVGNDMHGVYADDVYQMVWTGGGEAFGSRIRASTGEPLDPDDTFNEISGAKLLRSIGVNVTGLSDVDVVGSGLAMTYSLTSRNVEGIRVDPSTGLALGSTAQFLATLAPTVVDYASFALHALGDAAFLVNDDTYLKVGTAYTGNRVATFAAERPVAMPVNDRFTPVVASNGDGYLVVWANGSSMYQQGSGILATRVDPETGAHLDDPPLELGLGEDPTVVSNGDGYMVFWLNTSEGDTRFNQRAVSRDGELGDENWGFVFDSVQAIETQVAWSGTHYAVAWFAQAARFDADGRSVLPAAGGEFIQDLGGAGFRYEGGGRGPVVAADTDPPPDRRTFLFVGDAENGTSFDVHAVRMRAETGAILGTTLVQSAHERPLLACDGSRFLVVSRNLATNDWDGVFVDPVSGLPVNGSEKVLVSAAAGTTATSLFYDGSAFGLVLEGPRLEPKYTQHAYLRRFDADLEPLDAEPGDLGVRLTWEPGFLWDNSVASAGGERGLFAYAAVDADRLGSAIKFSLFAADGTVPPDPPLTGAGGSDSAAGGGSGDAGEANGSGGSDSTGGTAGSRAGSAGTNPGDDAGAAGTGEAGQGAADGGAQATGGSAGRTSGSSGSDSGGGGDDGDDNGHRDSRDSGGCGCRLGPSESLRVWPFVGLLLFAASRRRRARP